MYDFKEEWSDKTYKHLNDAIGALKHLKEDVNSYRLTTDEEYVRRIHETVRFNAHAEKYEKEMKRINEMLEDKDWFEPRRARIARFNATSTEQIKLISFEMLFQATSADYHLLLDDSSFKSTIGSSG